MKLHEHFFQAFIYLSYFIYLCLAVGVIAKEPSYFTFLKYYIEIFIAIFLIWRFRPHYFFPNLKQNWDAFDRKIAFSAGLFILTTELVEPIYKQFFTTEREALYS